MTGDWRDRAPLPLLSDLGPDGEPHGTSLDRRWQLQSDMKQYLDQTCVHHWRRYEGDDWIPAHSQCLWCNDVMDPS